ncbi:metallophosphoesterase family protein [Candidatus Uabimicrobium amorphum]|uniref:Serine/threonine protein phosphatase n=1 Tax=Uabimicrobium amorphum TaxID=2596890 RepID=A0A5S9IID2_UABAM|nr:metallophosphoesterase family protein [Candidatus Uabimicrobium amorphum]BBM82363.1 serine/threonine protein phosphatase [Candidatus Uabimicrobium amorphum]
MRHWVIGDIHGCANALQALLNTIPLSDSDAIITVGDYVDRGPNSYGVIEQLLHIVKSHRLYPLRGNHEIMMLRARDNSDDYEEWLRNGGDKTLASYSPLGDAGNIHDIPDHHWSFLENCLPYYETINHFVVHANAYPDYPLNEQPDYMLYWERLNIAAAHMSGKTMICGHTPQKTGLPQQQSHAVCIDTYAHGGGWLTCLNLETFKYWQANQQQQVRSDYLPLFLP